MAAFKKSQQLDAMTKRIRSTVFTFTRADMATARPSLLITTTARPSASLLDEVRSTLEMSS